MVSSRLNGVLQESVDVERLDIGGNWIMPEGGRAISKLLEENEYITEMVSTLLSVVFPSVTLFVFLFLCVCIHPHAPYIHQPAPCMCICFSCLYLSACLLNCQVKVMTVI